MLVQAVDEQGHPLPNASISIAMKRLGFPFGSAINSYILNNSAYQNWFTSRFTVTTFANEMKWYSTEYEQGKENYSVADDMLHLPSNTIFPFEATIYFGMILVTNLVGFLHSHPASLTQQSKRG